MEETDMMDAGVVAKANGRDVEAILSSIIRWREAKGNRWMFEVD